MSRFLSFLQWSPFAFGIVMVVVLMLANELAMRWGRWRRKKNMNLPDEATSIVVGTILALLAFVLALNLSNAGNRLQQRQEAALAEANAISTAWLQAGAAGGAAAGALQDEMRQYIAARRAYVSAPPDDGAIDGFNQATSDLQNKIWQHVTALVASSPGPTTSSLMNAVNNMFDSSTAMRYAMNYHMPMQIIVLLLLLTVVGMAGIGYQFGQMQQGGHRPALVLSLLWTLVVIQILDTGMSRIWTMQADDRTYRWTMQSMRMPTPD